MPYTWDIVKIIACIFSFVIPSTQVSFEFFFSFFLCVPLFCVCELILVLLASCISAAITDNIDFIQGCLGCICINFVLMLLNPLLQINLYPQE